MGFPQLFARATTLKEVQGWTAPNQNLACFDCYLKFFNTVLKNDTSILKQNVWETQKWHGNSTRPSSFWVIVKNNMGCDQAKSVCSHSNSIYIFLTNCMHHFHSYILQKIPLNLVNWFQRYEQVKNVKNNRKQKTVSALFDSILKSIFPTSDWFCLITSHILCVLIMSNGHPHNNSVQTIS